MPKDLPCPSQRPKCVLAAVAVNLKTGVFDGADPRYRADQAPINESMKRCIRNNPAKPKANQRIPVEANILDLVKQGRLAVYVRIRHYIRVRRSFTVRSVAALIHLGCRARLIAQTAAERFEIQT
jgi:hypothetical protein